MARGLSGYPTPSSYLHILPVRIRDLPITCRRFLSITGPSLSLADPSCQRQWLSCHLQILPVRSRGLPVTYKPFLLVFNYLILHRFTGQASLAKHLSGVVQTGSLTGFPSRYTSLSGLLRFFGPCRKTKLFSERNQKTPDGAGAFYLWRLPSRLVGTSARFTGLRKTIW